MTDRYVNFNAVLEAFGDRSIRHHRRGSDGASHRTRRLPVAAGLARGTHARSTVVLAHWWTLDPAASVARQVQAARFRTRNLLDRVRHRLGRGSAIACPIGNWQALLDKSAGSQTAADC